jgi:hypothetical protein
MSRSKEETKAARHSRLIAIALGLLLAAYGAAMMHRGFLAYSNSYRMTVFAPAVVVTGIIFVLLGVLPNSWVAFFVRNRSRHRN